MQRIRPAVTLLSQEIGLDHALASRRVYTDGAEAIYDYARDSDDEALLTFVRTGQQHLAEVIRAYLQPITYGDDGWVERMRLPAYAAANVVVDPIRPSGSRSSSMAEAVWKTSSIASRLATARQRSQTTSVSHALASRMSFASRFGVPPEFFIDRSLGRHAVPAALREAGVTVHTMADIYGEPRADHPALLHPGLVRCREMGWRLDADDSRPGPARP